MTDTLGVLSGILIGVNFMSNDVVVYNSERFTYCDDYIIVNFPEHKTSFLLSTRGSQYYTYCVPINPYSKHGHQQVPLYKKVYKEHQEKVKQGAITVVKRKLKDVTIYTLREDFGCNIRSFINSYLRSSRLIYITWNRCLEPRGWPNLNECSMDILRKKVDGKYVIEKVLEVTSA